MELSTGAESFRIFDAIDAGIPDVREYLEAIEFGITEYYKDQAVESDLQIPLPSADFTIKELYIEPGHTEVRHFKLVGAFAARQFHKELNKSSGRV